MKSKSIALVVYGGRDPSRNALTEDNYKALADALSESGFNVESIPYQDSKAEEIKNDLGRFAALLVWVNPVEQGADRQLLDSILSDISKTGVYVSTHPEVIEKIGTKEVLYSTRNMDWGGDIELYSNSEDFEKRFLNSLDCSGPRILKKHRGDSGNGIFKVCPEGAKHVRVIHAASAKEERLLSKDDFFSEFKVYFEKDGLLVNQKWNPGITNGMVRCYITGTKVSGFGYQESIALCPHQSNSTQNGSKLRPISRRFYYSEDCGMFQDLRKIMEAKWIPELQEIHSISEDLMPMLWDIDLFINDVNTKHTEEKYTLCEINVSCVSPFPPSCVKYIVEGLRSKLGEK